MELNNILNTIINHGIVLKSSGTTGVPKEIFQPPEKIVAANRVAVDSQRITQFSKVYTVCKMEHAGGMLAQTLPAYSVGADIDVEPFNAYTWIRKIYNYTHSHLTPAQANAVTTTKGFDNIDLSNVWITCGSDPVSWDIIEAFVARGATFMANWGMTEIGPIAINATYRSVDEVQESKRRQAKGTILGNTYYCDYKIINNELHVKGDISVYGDIWFATGDIVSKNPLGELFYVGRKSVL
jgi:acyl-CoA synthetase (AMP-forming)/AMP-acid ligase II